MILFSSKTFYEGQLQAIKIRSLPSEDMIRFDILGGSEDAPKQSKNANFQDTEFVLKELRRMIDAGDDWSAGIITPFREQVKLLNEVLYRDPYAERFDAELRLKVMSFDTCQGEERDLIIYSMVATDWHHALNYVFPVSPGDVADRVEEALNVQRLNVGFSRAKDGTLFVLFKPVERFRGAIARVLMHYKNLLKNRYLPQESDTDPASPMERKVLDWLGGVQRVRCTVHQFCQNEALR